MGWASRTATVAGAARATRGQYSLAERLRATLPMLGAAATGRWRGVSPGRLWLSVAGIAYVLSPLDLMPEVLLGPFGLGDDLAIAVAAMASLLSAADAYLTFRAGNESGRAGNAGETIEGVVIHRTQGG